MLPSTEMTTFQANLTAKQKRFVDEYLVDLNATQAAIRAGYSKKTASSIGDENLRKPDIQEYLQARMSEREERTEITQDMVLQEFWNIAIADANDLVEFRRTCCRHCYGIDFKYQRTTAEMERDYDAYEKTLANARPAESAQIGEFDEKGSIGYDARLKPNSECPECFGEGVGSVFVKDTRYLSPAARALYAGAKQAKEGLEIKTNSKEKALEMVARHLGMFTDKVEHSGPGGKPLMPPLFNVTFTDDQSGGSGG